MWETRSNRENTCPWTAIIVVALFLFGCLSVPIIFHDEMYPMLTADAASSRTTNSSYCPVTFALGLPAYDFSRWPMPGQAPVQLNSQASNYSVSADLPELLMSTADVLLAIPLLSMVKRHKGKQPYVRRVLPGPVSIPTTELDRRFISRAWDVAYLCQELDNGDQNKAAQEISQRLVSLRLSLRMNRSIFAQCFGLDALELFEIENGAATIENAKRVIACIEAKDIKNI